MPQPELPPNAGEASIAQLDKLRYAKGSKPTAQIRRTMQRVMQADAAVFRTQVRMLGIPSISSGFGIVRRNVRKYLCLQDCRTSVYSD